MLSGLNHLTLAVSQLAPSVAFYQQLGDDAARPLG
jgi:catechol 2,3-dioxygenase-like lactoylglutathione lyase family enzyme